MPVDAITQTLLGATAALAAGHRRLGRRAALPGAVGGELADLDVLLGGSDPALPMEFHRHFTHALVFVPVIGLLAAAPFLLVRPWRKDWNHLVLAATAGAATHPLIDSCTTWGTHLLWPFTGARVAWDVIAIIDPVFTLLLVIGLAWALLRGSPRPACVALLACLAYLGLGLVQHGRAAAAQARLAASRGHEIVRGRVMPTLGNLTVWRSVYESPDGVLHADAVRAGLGASAVREGGRVPLATLDSLPPAAQGSPRMIQVFSRFDRFADGYVARPPGRPEVVADMRYSTDPAAFAPLWGIEFSMRGDEADVRFASLGGPRSGTLRDLWRDVVRGTGYLPLRQPHSGQRSPEVPRRS